MRMGTAKAYQAALQAARDRLVRVVQTTTCPLCARPPGTPCHTSAGKPKPSPHRGRIDRMVWRGPDLTVDVMLKKAEQPPAAAAELAGVDLGALFNIDLVRPQP